MLRAQLNTVSNFLSDATTPESVFIVPTHDIVSDKMMVLTPRKISRERKIFRRV